MTKVKILKVNKLKTDRDSSISKYKISIELETKNLIESYISVSYKPIRCISTGNVEHLLGHSIASQISIIVNKFDLGETLIFPIEIEEWEL